MADGVAGGDGGHGTPGDPDGARRRTDDVSERLADASDATVVVAIARYSQEALAEAYRRHAGAVFGLAKRLLGNQPLAEEVVQEVFLRLWNDPGRYDPSRGTLRSYLLAQCHGRSVDLLRSEGSRRLREERDARRTAEAGYDLEHEVWDMAAADQVRRAVGALPAAERSAIELAYFGGLTYREVAERLGEPEGTVKSRIRAGLRRLRSELVAVGVTVGEP
jgi:RNA polymerase sigma-70 factor (ECF subfamily)